MKIRVTVYSFFFAMFVALRFLPSLFGNAVVSFLSNAFLLGAVAFLILKKYKPSKFMVIASLYMLFLIVMSFINKTDRADYHLIISYSKMLAFLCVTEWSLKEDTERAINTLFYVLLFYALLDFGSVILFPDGIYYKETIWNEWSTTYVPQWIFGNKNNRVYWYLSLLLTACWKQELQNSLKMQVALLALCIMSLVAVLICNSITSLMVLCIAVLGIWIGYFKRSEPELQMNANIVYPAYLGFSVLWITGNVTFLRGFIEGVLGRDMTFTKRTDAWSRALLQILRKPIFGSGVFGEKATTILGSKAFVNAHNQILETLWQGGIVALAVFSTLIITIAGAINRITENKKKLFLILMLVAILVEMLAESILGVDATWVYLLLCYQFANALSGRETDTEEEENEE